MKMIANQQLIKTVPHVPVTNSWSVCISGHIVQEAQVRKAGSIFSLLLLFAADAADAAVCCS